MSAGSPGAPTPAWLVPVLVAGSVTAALTPAPPAPARPAVQILTGPGLAPARREAEAVAGAWRSRDVHVDSDASMPPSRARFLARMCTSQRPRPPRDQSPLFSRLDLADGPIFAYDLQDGGIAARSIVLSGVRDRRIDARPGRGRSGSNTPAGPGRVQRGGRGHPRSPTTWPPTSRATSTVAWRLVCHRGCRSRVRDCGERPRRRRVWRLRPPLLTEPGAVDQQPGTKGQLVGAGAGRPVSASAQARMIIMTPPAAFIQARRPGELASQSRARPASYCHNAVAGHRDGKEGQPEDHGLHPDRPMAGRDECRRSATKRRSSWVGRAHQEAVPQSMRGVPLRPGIHLARLLTRHRGAGS